MLEAPVSPLLKSPGDVQEKNTIIINSCILCDFTSLAEPPRMIGIHAGKPLSRAPSQFPRGAVPEWGTGSLCPAPGAWRAQVRCCKESESGTSPARTCTSASQREPLSKGKGCEGVVVGCKPLLQAGPNRTYRETPGGQSLNSPVFSELPFSPPWRKQRSVMPPQ